MSCLKLRAATRSRRQRDRLFRTILLTGDGMLLPFTGDFLDQHDRVSDLVGIEDVRCQRVTAAVAGTAVRVDRDATHRAATPNVSGSAATDRNPAAQVRSWP